MINTLEANGRYILQSKSVGPKSPNSVQRSKTVVNRRNNPSGCLRHVPRLITQQHWLILERSTTATPITSGDEPILLESFKAQGSRIGHHQCRKHQQLTPHWITTRTKLQRRYPQIGSISSQHNRASFPPALSISLTQNSSHQKPTEQHEGPTTTSFGFTTS